MARKLVLLLWVLVAMGAQARPVDDLCPGCDCLRHECFTPGCDCTLPINGPWCEVMVQRIRQRLVGELGARIEVPEKLHIKLIDPTKMVVYGAGDGVQGLYEDGQISLSSILSRRQAIVVLAHEYGHAWQCAFHPRYDEVDGALREGWAEWVALQALRRFGEGTGGDALRSNRDPVYGGGLRWFLQVEKNFGRQAVFDQATTWLDTNGARVAPPPPKKPPKQPERKSDDPSLPDDMSEPGDSNPDSQTTPGTTSGGLR